MNLLQRERHMMSWSVLAILLPAIILLTYRAIPDQPVQPLLQPSKGIPLDELIMQREKKSYTISVRSNSDHTQTQLEWVNKDALTIPTATIYKGKIGLLQPSNGLVVGRIEARGNYYFTTDSSWLHPGFTILVYDFIHQQVADTINF